MTTLAQLPMTFLQNLLLTNPGVGYFALGVSDYPQGTYPQGVPRAAVLKAFLANVPSNGLPFNNLTVGLQSNIGPGGTPPSPGPYLISASLASAPSTGAGGSVLGNVGGGPLPSTVVSAAEQVA